MRMRPMTVRRWLAARESLWVCFIDWFWPFCSYRHCSNTPAKALGGQICYIMEHVPKSDIDLKDLLLMGFRRSSDVMFYSDPNGIILNINDSFTAHYGYTREEVIGKTPALLRSRHSTDELYKRMWRSILDPDKGYWRGELINRAKDGREVPLILTITAVRNEAGQILGYISNGVDL